MARHQKASHGDRPFELPHCLRQMDMCFSPASLCLRSESNFNLGDASHNVVLLRCGPFNARRVECREQFAVTHNTFLMRQ